MFAFALTGAALSDTETLGAATLALRLRLNAPYNFVLSIFLKIAFDSFVC